MNWTNALGYWFTISNYWVRLFYDTDFMSRMVGLYWNMIRIYRWVRSLDCSVWFWYLFIVNVFKTSGGMVWHVYKSKKLKFYNMICQICMQCLVKIIQHKIIQFLDHSLIFSKFLYVVVSVCFTVMLFIIENNFSVLLIIIVFLFNSLK